MQIEKNIYVNGGEKRIKENLKKLNLQISKWRHDDRNALCWSFYYVNGNKPVDVKSSQLTRFIICYASSVLITNAKT